MYLRDTATRYTKAKIIKKNSMKIIMVIIVIFDRKMSIIPYDKNIVLAENVNKLNAGNTLTVPVEKIVFN